MSDLVRPAAVTVEAEFPEEAQPEVGHWFWINGGDRKDSDDRTGSDRKTRWLGCITQIGSNYYEMTSIKEGTARIHFNEFDAICIPEPDPEAYIRDQVALYESKSKHLLGEIQRVTALLGVGDRKSLNGPQTDTGAIVVAASRVPVEDYKAALIKAKDKTLPELFEQVEENHKSMVRWMKASMLPLKAQAKGMGAILDKINSRIFNVELYAGLTEQIIQIRDGEPAPNDAQVHLFQRRAYMDEEALLSYEAGGMDFENIHGFDKWLARNENMQRLLPFERCVLAFKVRRKAKRYEVRGIRDFIRFGQLAEANESTFLYIRNGERLYCLETKIDFGAKLFPDLDAQQLKGKLYAELGFMQKVEKLITEKDYEYLLEEERRKNAEYEATPKEERFGKFGHRWGKVTDTYIPYTKDRVEFDDITQFIHDEMQRHNRVVLVLQGLLDRSPVFQPHPPWRVYEDAGFQAAFKLIFDSDRALYSGKPPDFEAYRKRLNASIRPGSITVGQEDAWLRAEGEKESDRRDRDYRWRQMDYRPEKYQPEGDPGPGQLAYVVKGSPRSQTVTFEWTRERAWNSKKEGRIPRTFTTDFDKVLNVSAYKPGDFKQFFLDPRTREDYLEWAPFLLIAEDFHAGKREVRPHEPKPQRAEPTWEEEKRNAKAKERRLLKKLYPEGTRVYPIGPLETTTGVKFASTDLMYVYRIEGSTLGLRRVSDDKGIRKISRLDVVRADSHLQVPTPVSHKNPTPVSTENTEPEDLEEDDSQEDDSEESEGLEEPEEDDSGDDDE